MGQGQDADKQRQNSSARSTAGHPVAHDPDFFSRMLDVDVSELAAHPDALREIYDEQRHGMIIRNVFPAEHMARVVERLERKDHPFPQTYFPERFGAYFYGRVLDGSDARLTEYLTDAERFRECARHLYRDGLDFEARIEEVFRALAGGRTVAIPRAPDGRAYTPATIRVLPEGGHIGTHCGNEASTRRAYTHLNTVIDRRDQISYFVTLQPPVAGGELVVSSFQWKHADSSMFDHGHTVVDHVLHLYEEKRFVPGAGDLIVFDGGRYFHRVDVVRGGTTRYTMGGFMMFDRDGKTVLYWS